MYRLIVMSPTYENAKASEMSTATPIPCHILFIRHTLGGDAKMRVQLGREAYDALNLTCSSSEHGLPWAGSYGPLVRKLYYSLQALRAQTSKRLVCYFVKEGWGPETELCHRYGAITLYEVVDNDKRSGIFFGYNYSWKGSPRDLLPVPSVDLWLVSTRKHVAALQPFARKYKIRAQTIAHPHSNMRIAESFDASQIDWTKAGVVATNKANMPAPATMEMLAKVRSAMPRRLWTRGPLAACPVRPLTLRSSAS